MTQIDPEMLTIKQLRQLLEMFNVWYDKITEEDQAKLAELKKNPEENAKAIDSLDSYLAEVFFGELDNYGLDQAYLYIQKIDSLKKPVKPEPMSKEEKELYELPF